MNPAPPAFSLKVRSRTSNFQGKRVAYPARIPLTTAPALSPWAMARTMALPTTMASQRVRRPDDVVLRPKNE